MLTRRQKQILEYIKKHIKENDYSPSLEEIGRYFKLSSLATVHQHLEALKLKGYLKNQPRTIQISENKKSPDLMEIPLLGLIAAGQPIEAIENPETITVPKSYVAKSGKHYALRVEGNSMIDEGIFDGDMVIIREQKTADNGQTVVAIIDENEATLKKIYRGKDRFRLQPANPSLFPIYRKEVEIRGIVVQIIRNLEMPTKRAILSREINSPFRYAGGKFYARKLILEYVPEHSCYVEPLAGGASIFFAKTKVKENWLNDIDKDLINCLIIIRDHPEKLIHRLQKEKAAKEKHNYYKNTYKPKTKLDRAVRWFYLNRTSYSGIMNAQNCYWGYGDKYSMRPENWPRNILRSSIKLQGVKLTSFDFEEVINKTKDGSFLFIDPPYFNADQDKFYVHSFKKKDHLRLCDALRKNNKRLKFLLTYDNNPEIKNLYKWTNYIYEKEWNYTINRTDDQKNGTKRKGTRYKGKELFILNYNSLARRKFF